MASFSVIIPVYQAEQYLKRCLESLQKQSYSEFEVIMIDDGSIDNSYSICRSFQKKDKRFYVVHQKNQGVSVARNRGLELAKYDYIVFVDSDDYVSNDYLENLNEALKEKEDICISTKFYDVIQGQVTLIEERSYETCYKWKSQEKIFEEFSKGEIAIPLATMNNCYRREFLTEHHIWFESSYVQSEDIDFIFKTYLFFKKAAWLKEGGYFYNKDNQFSATHKISLAGLKSTLQVCEKWYYFCVEKEGKAYQNWAEYFSKMGNTYLVLGSQLTRKERKQIFSYDKKSIEFYRGNSNKLKLLILDLYKTLGYENAVLIAAILSKIKLKLACIFRKNKNSIKNA